MKYSSEDLERIARYEEKRGIKYAKIGGKLYNRLLLSGFAFWLWMMVTQMFYVLGTFITVSAGNGEYNNVFVTVLTTFFVSLLSILLYALRFRVSAFAVNICAAVISAIAFMGITRVGDSISNAGAVITEFDQGYFGLRKMFYWRHGIPIALVLVLFSVLIIITVREKVIRKKEITLISENNYEPKIIADDE